MMIYDGTQSYAKDPNQFNHDDQQVTMNDMKSKKDRNNFGQYHFYSHKAQARTFILARVITMIGALVLGIAGLYAVLMMSFAPAKQADITNYGASAETVSKIVNNLSSEKDRYYQAIEQAKSTHGIDRVEAISDARKEANDYNAQYGKYSAKYDLDKMITGYYHGREGNFPKSLEVPSMWQTDF